MSAALENLIRLLDLEEIDDNVYRGQNEPDQRTRLFGGQVAAQALVAAGRTVEGRAPHSLHAYFLRGGDPRRPVLYTVDPIRDGRSFTTRRVVALQRGRAIFNMSVSFHERESGFDHAATLPEQAGDPDEIPSLAQRLEEMGDKVPSEYREWMAREHPVEFRARAGTGFIGGGSGEAPAGMWLRANGALPEDPFLHQCILAYASDMGLLDAMARRHVAGPAFMHVMAASLDHAIWFHREARLDDWIYYQMDSPSASGARGFARGSLFARDGTLLASVAQEGLIRPLRREKAET